MSFFLHHPGLKLMIWDTKGKLWSLWTKFLVCVKYWSFVPVCDDPGKTLNILQTAPLGGGGGTRSRVPEEGCFGFGVSHHFSRKSRKRYAARSNVKPDCSPSSTKNWVRVCSAGNKPIRKRCNCVTNHHEKISRIHKMKFESVRKQRGDGSSNGGLKGAEEVKRREEHEFKRRRQERLHKVTPL